jgi:TRAP-type C4-dicarboxylate transport system permease small subunit
MRRIAKFTLILIFTCATIWGSFMAIQEKWRIRHEWGFKNWDSLTEKEQSKLIADGANLTMGPLIFGGGYAFLFFGIALIISSIAVKKISSKDSQKELERYIALKTNEI